mmetsp:Transcript_21556/g.27912  ORF Transcript_21556/g.27912 Transcript_21556/m.27912 type:complete len:98 (+) Transcript_21556:203-496(+)
MWNISNIPQSALNEPEHLINCTNNPLERYNRTLNEAFPTAHPNMMQFVQTIKAESHRILHELELIKHGAMKSPEHMPPTRIVIPEEYCCFVPKKEDV